MRFVSSAIDHLKAYIFYPRQFKRYGKGSLIKTPLRIDGARNIAIGQNVCVNKHTWLACLPLTGNDNPHLEIGDGCVIGNYNHIYATQSIVMESDVLTADKVYISDNGHGYEDPDTPVLHQSVKQLKAVRIGAGSWLGENVCVVGASIGKHCVIGANSVVTKDIPDYSVAVGAPARVVKQYDFEKKGWVKA